MLTGTRKLEEAKIWHLTYWLFCLKPICHFSTFQDLEEAHRPSHLAVFSKKSIAFSPHRTITIIIGVLVSNGSDVSWCELHDVMDHYWFETEGQTLREGKEGCEASISVSQFSHTYSKVKQRQRFEGKLNRWRGLLFWYRPYLSFLLNPLLLFFL